MTEPNDRNARRLVRASRNGGAELAVGPTARGPLDEVLAAVRLTGALYFVVDASSPYCIDVPHARAYRGIILPEAQHVFSYHVILEGEGIASAGGAAPERYGPGDVILFPQGDGSVMGTTLDTPPEFSREEAIDFFRALAAGALPFTIEEGGGGAPQTRVICGFLGCDARPFNPVLAGLPAMLRLPGAADPGAGGRDGALARLIALTMEEAESGDAGGASVRLRLSELMFMEVLRRWAETPGAAPQGWLAGLRDGAVGRALAALHAEPARRWTLDALAADAALSRSALARRFADRVGVPPLRYLALWRMQLAARMLTEEATPVGEIGRRVGYEAEAAFSRGFKRIVGMSPEAWRRGGGAAEGGEAPKVG